MQIIEVPYREQLAETSCGIAAFEMVYKYFRPSKLSKFSQQKVFERLKAPTPSQTTLRVTTESIVELARNRGFHAGWGRVNVVPNILVSQIRFFIETKSLPLIACQQWHKDPTIGHFRVIIGIDESEVAFHDPEKKHGGEALRLSLDKFIDSWRWNDGGNVTGGVAIWIADHDIAGPLDPALPNLWFAT